MPPRRLRARAGNNWREERGRRGGRAASSQLLCASSWRSHKCAPGDDAEVRDAHALAACDPEGQAAGEKKNKKRKKRGRETRKLRQVRRRARGLMRELRGRGSEMDMVRCCAAGPLCSASPALAAVPRAVSKPQWRAIHFERVTIAILRRCSGLAHPNLALCCCC